MERVYNLHAYPAVGRMCAGCVRAVDNSFTVIHGPCTGCAHAVHGRMQVMHAFHASPSLPETRCASCPVLPVRGRRLPFPGRAGTVAGSAPARAAAAGTGKARGRDARSTCGMREGRKAHGKARNRHPCRGRPAGAPERKRLMYNIWQFAEPAAACLLALLLCIRAAEKRGKLRALLYGIALLLVLLACSPALRKGFMLRALLRLLG